MYIPKWFVQACLLQTFLSQQSTDDGSIGVYIAAHEADVVVGLGGIAGGCHALHVTKPKLWLSTVADLEHVVSGVLSEDTWMHIAVTVTENHKVSIFINGQLCLISFDMCFSM